MQLKVHGAGVRNEVAERRFQRFAVLIGGAVFLIFALELLDRTGVITGRIQAYTYPVEVALELLLFWVVIVTPPQFIREMRRRRALAIEAHAARSQIELLFKMTDMLQSALGHADANSVLRSTAASLMPGFGGALYIFNNSGDRLELSTSWEWPDSIPLSSAIAPSDCWAIKRGKLHLNLANEHALCCDHHHSSLVTMEIPMMARGEIYGLLLVERAGDEAQAELQSMATVANALADAMSLSLSNIALRERLRTQALRDALTGLYNRRYMEDALDRSVDQAIRSQSSLSVVMIDLDHFKKLNDEHGHAMGDVVLAETAAAILSCIRPCDIACRYGGEELAILLPECSIDEACTKAEAIRSRIERLSDNHGIAISASFGVASIPETSKAKEVMTDADRALYRAKKEGRNRVETASPPPLRDIAMPSTSKAA